MSSSVHGSNADEDHEKKKNKRSSLEERLTSTNQLHLLEAIPHLLSDTNHPVHKQLDEIDIPHVLRDLQQSIDATNIPSASLSVKPVSTSTNWTDLDTVSKKELTELGLAAIRCNTTCVVILSGGQGTRLGFDGPKGMYRPGMPSNKCIFQLHIERVSRIKALSGATSLPIYIMTSDLNDTTIKAYFKSNDYFGYSVLDIYFFEQSLLPCLTSTGSIILESETTLARAPCGNGGIYAALEASGAMANMISRGIQHVHVYGIDNILTKPLDPGFIGLCIKHKAEVGNKVVWRRSKNEKVGVTAERADGRLTVVEYSDIPIAMAEEEDINGKLIFGAANICNHYFSVAFLRDKVMGNSKLPYHIAHKKIPYFDAASQTTITPTQNNGVKLELFIFDVFSLAESWVVMEVERREEFAPVKNEPGSLSDSPDTARKLMSEQAKRWLSRVGCSFNTDSENKSADEQDLCEISPLVSYEGEGLEKWTHQVVSLPCYISSASPSF